MKLSLYTLLSDTDLTCPPNARRVEVTFETIWLANGRFYEAINKVYAKLECAGWRVQLDQQGPFYTLVITR
jgi:hypothetical protein